MSKKKYYDPIDYTRCVGVAQNEYGLTEGGCKKNILFTEGVGPCIVIIIHDPNKKLAILAHADNEQGSTKNFKALLKELIYRGCKPSQLKTYLIGGYSGDKIFGEYNNLPKAIDAFLDEVGLKNVDRSHLFERDMERKADKESRVPLSEVSFPLVAFNASKGELLIHDNDKKHKLPIMDCYYQYNLSARDEENDLRIESGDYSFRPSFIFDSSKTQER